MLTIQVNANVSNVWDLRLGHPNVHALRFVLQSCIIPFHNKDNTIFCSSYFMGN